MVLVCFGLTVFVPIFVIMAIIMVVALVTVVVMIVIVAVLVLVELAEFIRQLGEAEARLFQGNRFAVLVDLTLAVQELEGRGGLFHGQGQTLLVLLPVPFGPLLLLACPLQGRGGLVEESLAPAYLQGVGGRIHGEKLGSGLDGTAGTPAFQDPHHGPPHGWSQAGPASDIIIF